MIAKGGKIMIYDDGHNNPYEAGKVIAAIHKTAASEDAVNSALEELDYEKQRISSARTGRRRKAMRWISF